MEQIVANAKTVNWSSLDRGTLYRYFLSLGREIVGKSLTPAQIQKKISKHIKQVIPVKITKIEDAGIKQGYVYIGGWYYSLLDRKKKPSIEVQFNYHPFDEKLKLSRFRWERMSIVFADLILHEIIHMRQFRARNFKMIPGYQSTAASIKERRDQEYYGDRDEMGAFAFNIACEMIDKFGYAPNEIKKYLNSNRAKRSKNSWWFKYMQTFNWDHDHMIIRRMKQKVIRQLENAYYGRPFRTNDFLTC